MNTDVAEAKLNAAASLKAAHNLEGAKRLITEVLAADPQSAAAHELLARVYLQQGRARQALEAIDACLALDPTGPALAVRALALSGLKYREAALEAARSAIASAPDDIYTLHITAAVLQDARQWREAEEVLTRAVTLSPSNDALHAALGMLHLRRNRPGIAARIAAEISAGCDLPTVLLLKGQLALRQGRATEARDLALWMLSQDATDPGALRLLTDVTAHQSLLLGLWWRYAALRNRSAWWLRGLLLAALLIVFKVPLLGPVVLVYFLGARMVFARRVRQELRTLSLKKKF